MRRLPHSVWAAGVLGWILTGLAACSAFDVNIRPYRALPPVGPRRVPIALSLGSIDVKPVFPDPKIVGLRGIVGKVYVDPEPKAWLTHAIKDEFLNVGLIFMPGDYPRLSVVAEQFFTESTTPAGFSLPDIVGVLALDVRVTLPNGGKTWERHFAHYVHDSGLITPNSLEGCSVGSARLTLQELAIELRRFVEEGT